jgi:nucleoside-diphosphate-sugar epimerase
MASTTATSSLRLPRVDLDATLELARSDLQALDGAALYFTGATGFYGRWLLESLAYAKARLGIRMDVELLTRSRERTLDDLGGAIALLDATVTQGDVRSPPAPVRVATHVIHAATSTTTARAGTDDPRELRSIILDGTRAVLALHTHSPRLLFASSGAIYGPQPPHVDAMGEDAPMRARSDDPTQVYGAAKLEAEQECIDAARTCGGACVIARGFAFCAPYLPMDAHFAVGNFLAAAAADQPIQVRGDGTAVRTYLHGIDLAAWMWAMLARGRDGAAYNLGGDEPVSIADLAEQIGTMAHVPVHRAAVPAPSIRSRYVPSVEKARAELGLTVSIPLEATLRRTFDWVRSARMR